MTQRLTLEQLSVVIDALPGKQFNAAVRGARSAALRFKGLIVDSIADTEPNPPEDTGELKRSIKVNKTRNGASVSVDAPHAPFMEFGTRPHFPPIGPLAEWVYRKGIADSEEEAEQIALAIARKIAKEGIKPRQFMARAISELKRKNIIKKEIIREMRKVK
jgi:hypothetical protein